MLELFLQELNRIWDWVFRIAQSWMWVWLGLAVVIVAARVAAAIVDGKYQTELSAEFARKFASAGTVAAALALTAILATVHAAGLRTFRNYQILQAPNRFRQDAASEATAVNQELPSVVLSSKRKIQKSITIPTRGSEIVPATPEQKEAVAEYTSSPPEETRYTPLPGAVRIDYVVFEEDESRIDLDSADLSIDLQPAPDADERGNGYQMAMTGRFQWRNLTDRTGKANFTLRIPEHEGTLVDVQLTINGESAPVETEESDLMFSREMKPGETMIAEVKYKTLGRGNLRIFPADAGRKISKLAVTLRTPIPVRFERGSLYPERVGDEYRWKLDSVITRQKISLAIPSLTQRREDWWKICTITPLALITFTLMALRMGGMQAGLSALLSGITAVFASLAFPLALPLANLPVLVLAVVAIALAGISGYLTLRRPGLVAALCASAVMLASIFWAYTAALAALAIIASSVLRARPAPEV